MKLLIVTQVVDKNHPVLGFFHRWIEEFAERCDVVQVICLQAGECELPSNVDVYSLGKEHGVGRLVYVSRFFKYCWRLRGQYDHVFVHMNQIYVILAGLLWRGLGKRVGLWYAHGTVTYSLRVAVAFSHKVFTSTDQGMRIQSRKKIVTGQGIDPVQFSRGSHSRSETLQLITIGRVGKSKHIDTLLRAVALLRQGNIECAFTIVGGPATVVEQQYEIEMHTLTQTLGIQDYVTWLGPQPHDSLPSLLKKADMFIHDGATNSLDKTLVEASFSGCVVISSNPSYRGLTEALAPELLFPPQDHEALADVISKQSQVSSLEVEAVRLHLLETCSIADLITRILVEYKK